MRQREPKKTDRVAGHAFHAVVPRCELEYWGPE
jgi:hypothetical protein